MHLFIFSCVSPEVWSVGSSQSSLTDRWRSQRPALSPSFMKTGDWESCESFLKLILRWRPVPVKVHVWSDVRGLCGSLSLQIPQPKKASVGAYCKQCDTRLWQTGLSRVRADRSTPYSCCVELNGSQQLREGCWLSCICSFCCGLTGRLCEFVSGSTEKSWAK